MSDGLNNVERLSHSLIYLQLHYVKSTRVKLVLTTYNLPYHSASSKLSIKTEWTSNTKKTKWM